MARVTTGRPAADRAEVNTSVDTQAIPRVAAAVDLGSGTNACPEDSGELKHADAMKNLAALHESWLEALAVLRGGPTQTADEQAAA